jgi:hypothetical protein
MRTLITAALAASLFLLPSAARADRRDWYVTLTAEPTSATVKDPITGGESGTEMGFGAFALSAFYGLTNTIHVGAALHYATEKNVSFGGVTIDQGGWPTTGTAYGNVATYSATALAQYRLDTGYSVAPVARAELGVASVHSTSAAFRPDGAGYTLAYPDKSEFALEARASLLAEYRFARSPRYLPGEQLVASVGIGFVARPGTASPTGLSVPVSLGFVW